MKLRVMPQLPPGDTQDERNYNALVQSIQSLNGILAAKSLKGFAFVVITDTPDRPGTRLTSYMSGDALQLIGAVQCLKDKLVDDAEDE